MQRQINNSTIIPIKLIYLSLFLALTAGCSWSKRWVCSCDDFSDTQYGMIPPPINSDGKIERKTIDSGKSIKADITRAKPAEYNLKLNETITIQGRFTEWNGWSPNIRILTKDGGIVGIGTSENDSILPEELRNLKNLEDWEVTVALTYIGNTGILYYEKPMQCFKIVKIVNKRMLK